MTDRQDIIYGINAVMSRLRRGDGLAKLVVREGASSRRVEELMQLASQIDCPVERCPADWFAGASSIAHQGVGLIVKAGEMKSEAFLDRLIGEAAGKLMFLVLDGVTDPRNLGACIRSAATLGIDAIIVPRDNSAPLNSAAVKTASGGAAAIPVVQVVNLSRCLDKLKKANVWVVGTMLDAPALIDEVDLTGNVALVMGAEGKGLRRNTAAHCDLLARIPMVNGEFGFNVSVAAGICLYEAWRQRKPV